jgi:hypothetical protein
VVRASFLVLAFAAGTQIPHAAEPEGCSRNPADVYAAMLAGIPRLTQTPGGEAAEQLVVLKTIGYREAMAVHFAPEWVDTLVSLLGIDSTTTSDFLEKNREDGVFRSSIIGTQTVVLVDPEEIESFFEGVGPDGWEASFARYPKAQGYLIVTHVGFSADGEEALLFYGDHKGRRHGIGEFVILKCEGARWWVERKQTAWVS